MAAVTSLADTGAREMDHAAAHSAANGQAASFRRLGLGMPGNRLVRYLLAASYFTKHDVPKRYQVLGEGADALQLLGRHRVLVQLPAEALLVDADGSSRLEAFGQSLRSSVTSLAASSSSRPALIVRRSQPASASIWPVLRKEAPMTTVLMPFACSSCRSRGPRGRRDLLRACSPAGRPCVPVEDAADEGRDQEHAGFGAGDGLGHGEEQRQVAVDAFASAAFRRRGCLPRWRRA